jgi:hypothetical protein
VSELGELIQLKGKNTSRRTLRATALLDNSTDSGDTGSDSKLYPILERGSISRGLG